MQCGPPVITFCQFRILQSNNDNTATTTRARPRPSRNNAPKSLTLADTNSRDGANNERPWGMHDSCHSYIETSMDILRLTQFIQAKPSAVIRSRATIEIAPLVLDHHLMVLMAILMVLPPQNQRNISIIIQLTRNGKIRKNNKAPRN